MWLKYGWVSGSMEIPSMTEQREKKIQNVDMQDRTKMDCAWGLSLGPSFALY